MFFNEFFSDNIDDNELNTTEGIEDFISSLSGLENSENMPFEPVSDELTEVFDASVPDLPDSLDELGGMSHHIDPGQIQTSLSQMFETEEITDVNFEESGILDEIRITGPYPISFTGLTDGGLITSDTYQSWLDGVDPDEVTAEDISTIAEHITDEFEQICPAVITDNNRKGFSIFPVENGIMLYDIDSTVTNANIYGIDNIVGSVAHEVGHNIAEKAFEGTGIVLTRIQQEMCADYLEGIAMGLAGVSPEAKYEFLTDHDCKSANYPSSAERIEIIQKGYDFASNPVHQILSPVLFPDLDFLRDELIENVLDVY